MFRKSLFIFLLSASTALAGSAKESHSEITVVGSGAFTKDSNAPGISQHANNAGGFLIGYAYDFNRWTAAEADYGYTRNTQAYLGGFGNQAIQSNVHLITGDFMFRLPEFIPKWRPYVLAGGGALIFDPTDSGKTAVSASDSQARGAFLYGAGVDFDLARHVALRAEYRGYVYDAPDFGVNHLKNDAITHLAQPSAGVVFRF
jgi:opacity protein-like surface antigen